MGMGYVSQEIEECYVYVYKATAHPEPPFHFHSIPFLFLCLTSSLTSHDHAKLCRLVVS